MSRVIAVPILLIVPFLLFSCGTTKEIQKPPQFHFGDVVLSKAIDDRGTKGIPLQPTTSFSTHDPEVIASLQLKNVSGSHSVRWEWYDPNGDLYCSTGNHPLYVSQGNYLRDSTAWHRLLIEGERAARYPGNWTLHLYLDDTLISSKAFALTSPAPSPLVPLASPFSKRRAYAVVVGISRYLHAGKSGLTTLPFADDDAEAFRDMLFNLGWDDDHIKCLTNERATQRDVIVSLGSWLTKAGPDDLIVLFWSGHGFPDPEDPEKVYFACYDTDLSVPVTGYRMDQVREVLKERNAKNVVIFADTCHAGKLITRGIKNISVQPYVEKLRHEHQVPKGWVFMVGADTDREAIEHSSWSNGAFTHCLIEALSGSADGFESVGPKDGVVSMGELRAYLEAVMPWQTQRVLGVAKHPTITTSTGDPEIWNLSLTMR